MLPRLLVLLLVVSVAPTSVGFAALVPPAVPAMGRLQADASAVAARQHSDVRALLGDLSLGTVLAPGRMGQAGITTALLDQASDRLGTLETRQPDVQWSPAGATGWQSVPT